MKTASLSDLKQELHALPPKKVLELCLALAKFKKENKELLTFLLFDAEDEHGYVETVKIEMDEVFAGLPRSTWFNTKKSLRKVLRLVARYSKYVARKESEVELLLHFCKGMQPLFSTYRRNMAFANLYALQVKKLSKLTDALHEDIRYDYERQVQQLLEF